MVSSGKGNIIMEGPTDINRPTVVSSFAPLQTHRETNSTCSAKLCKRIQKLRDLKDGILLKAKQTITKISVAIANGRFHVTNQHECARLLVSQLNADVKLEKRCCLAWQKGYLDILKKCWNKDGTVNVVVKYSGNTPLHTALYTNQLAFAKLLVSQLNANVTIANKKGIQPLHLACQKGYLDLVKQIVAKGGDVNAVDECGHTPLLDALYANHAECARFLISHNAYVTLADKNRVTPLYLACQYNHMDLAKQIIDHGDVNAVEEDTGNTQLHQALFTSFYTKSAKCAELLIAQSNTDVKISNKKGVTPLHLACKNRYSAFCQKDFLNLVRLIVDKGGNVNAVDESGYTPLLDALSTCNVECARLLISELNADVTIANKNGVTPFHLACKMGYSDLVKKIVDQGGNVNAVDDCGEAV